MVSRAIGPSAEGHRLQRARTDAPRVTVQFHPNWPHDGRLVIESMAADGIYRSQFETGISNGGLTAFVGGDRWRWESRLFDGRYDDAPTSARPVYGAWNRRGDPYGGAIRFGSAYLRLRPEVTARSTFCFPDSVLEPVDVGGPDLLTQLTRMADVELTPRVVGDAARAGHHPPQHIKQVWHCLARFGRTSVDT